MTNYYKKTIELLYSEDKDFTDPKVLDKIETTGSYTIYWHQIVTIQTTTTKIYENSYTPITTLEYVIIKNLDDTNYISLSHRDSAPAKVDRVGPGKILILTDEDDPTNVDITAQANSAACDIEVLILGD